MGRESVPAEQGLKESHARPIPIASNGIFCILEQGDLSPPYHQEITELGILRRLLLGLLLNAICN